MKFLPATIVMACLAALATPAAAAVQYHFEATGLSYEERNDPLDPDLVTFQTNYNGSFDLTTASPITVAGFYPTDACSVSIAQLLCGPTQEFNPDAFGLGLNFVGFQTVNADASGSGGAFFFFSADAFTTNGTHATVDPGASFGNAAPGILTVTGIDEIPEPASLALLGSGLLGIAQLRRRTVPIPAR